MSPPFGVLEINDPQDPRLTPFRSLRDATLRDVGARPPTAGQALGPSVFLAESEDLIRRAVLTGHRLASVLADPPSLARLSDVIADALDSADEVMVAPARVIASITGLGVHRGALALFHRPLAIGVHALLAAPIRRVVALEGVGNPVNVGLIARSALAFGVQALLMDPESADPLYRRALTASRGAALALPWARFESSSSMLDALHTAGFQTIALTLAPDSVPLEDGVRIAVERSIGQMGKAKVAMLLGNEGSGLRPATQASCTVCASIDVESGPAVDSLNVAAAAAIACYELKRAF